MRASQWQGTTASLLAKSLNLPRIVQPGFSCDSQERRVFTVRTNSGVSPTIPRSAIQSALCSQLQPLLDGNTRQSHPQGDWCIDPDPAAPHYADLMRLLNPGSIYLPIPGTSESTIVKVDNSFRLSPLMPLKLLFRQIPIECSGIGFPEAVLEHAGYRVVASSDRPLRAPPSGSVHIIKYWAGTDKESRQPDDSIICIHVLPPVDDPHLRHLPPRLILGGGRQDVFTSVERDPLPHVPRHLLARDAPDAAFLPDHLDFGAFRREPEDMDGVETAAEQRAATPPDPAPAAAPLPPERPVATSSAQSASGAQAAETLADQQQLTEDGDGEVFRLPMPPAHLFRANDRVTHGAPFIASVSNPAPPPAVAAAAAFLQASDPSSLPETATAARVSTTLFPQPGPAPSGGRSGLRSSTCPPPSPPQQQHTAFSPPPPPPPQQQKTAPSLSPPPPAQQQKLNHMPHPHPLPPFMIRPPLLGHRRSAPSTADRSSNWRASASPPRPLPPMQRPSSPSSRRCPDYLEPPADPFLANIRETRRACLAERQASGRRWFGQVQETSLTRRGRGDTSVAGSEELPKRVRRQPSEWWRISSPPSPSAHPPGKPAQRGPTKARPARSPRPAGRG